MHKITTISEYLDVLKNLSELNESTRFFRGHSNMEYKMMPGIYRNVKKDERQRLLKHEADIYRDMISQSPQDFEGKNTIESLTLMQHYGVPTRILDVTQNALVALYFACVGDIDEKDGEVIVLNIPNREVCNYNSDRITVLFNLVKDNNIYYSNSEYRAWIKFWHDYLLNNEKNKKPSSIVDFGIEHNVSCFFLQYEISISIEELYSIDIKNYYQTKLEEVKNDYLKFVDLGDVEFNTFSDYFEYRYIINLYHSINDRIASLLKEINNTFSFQKLVHNIREDKPYFLPLINPTDISSILAIKPKLDNPRIIRQHGAFLVFGINDRFSYLNEHHCLKIKDNWFNNVGEKGKIYIDKGAKRSLLNELEALGINKAFLFPEVDKVAETIIDKYKNKLNN